MNMIKTSKRIFLLIISSVMAPGAFGAGTAITNVDATFDGNAVRITVELTSPVRPTFWALDKPSRLIFDFPNVTLVNLPSRIAVNHAGVAEVRAEMNHGVSSGVRISVDTDRLPRFGMKTLGNKVVLTISSQAWPGKSTSAKTAVALADDRVTLSANDPVPESANSINNRVTDSGTGRETAARMIAALATAVPPEVESIPVEARIDEPPIESPATVRHRFRIKFVSGNTVYIDGGANSGLRAGMNLDIWSASANSETKPSGEGPIAAAGIVGIATTSAILEVGASSSDLHVGDWAELLPKDADAAHKNVLTAPDNTLLADARPVDDDSDSSAPPAAVGFRNTKAANEDLVTRTAGRIGFDYSGISSSGSTPGTSQQLGMSFQSDIQHIMGSHWNLEGYWRGRVNRHSQFAENTIDDTLNKTYTMQLYYDNPNAKWVAGLGRLYLPWAVSLDTVDGGYFGRKLRPGNTTGVFAGSTPDPTSWHYRPNQRIAGMFTNFEGGDYDRIHYSSTTGVGLTSIRWKLDRPFAFFENEFSYKGKLSAFHSLIADAPLGPSTNGIRPGAGISHSYFTLHYQPYSVVALDLYHNFFRDVPTVPTSIIGTGLVDKLLFQGISGGTHVRPTRYFTLYTTLGTSERTGDAHRSLNEMFGATWNEIARTGLRADYHYSKFDSNFGSGNYQVFSLSRQMTNRMFWNVQLGKQDIVSSHTLDCFSNFVDDSVDINLGRHSYLQSGYTYVKGDTMNYRQWYMSWGYRLDAGRKNPQYVQTLVPHQ
jgi:hypothetical protein